MPVLPPQPAASYDTANDVLNMTRGRLNDSLKTLLPVSGKLLDNGQIFIQQTFNTAYRKCQAFLADKGYARLIDEVIIQALPVVASLDPAIQTWLSWSGYFDGANLFQQPALPQGFNHPIKIWERWSNQNAQFGNPPMEKFLDGIPACSKTTAIRFWEWRNDAIYMPGSQMVEDLRIRFVMFFPDLVDAGPTQWYQQPVPIVRVSDGLSWFLCAELAGARGDQVAEQDFTRKGEDALRQVFNLDVKANQRVNVRRLPRSGRGFGRSWY